MRTKLIAVLMLALILPVAAWASEYEAFSRDIMKPYGFYKKSLALTSKEKNQEKAVVVVQKFISSWEKFADKYAQDIPDRLRRVANFSATIKRPVLVGKEALELLQAGEVKKSHHRLEEVRYLLWRMRVEAGVTSLNDKVNDFHEAMEIVLDGIAKDGSPEHLRHLGNRYGAWLAIKWAEVAAAGTSASDQKAFSGAVADGEQAIAGLIEILKKGADAAAAQKAGKKIKKSYKAVFFLPECS